MKYCENCHVLCEGDYCAKCNNSEIREVKDDDFCLFFESGAEFGEVFKETMEKSGAVCSLMPYCAGARVGLKIAYQVYVPYRFMDTAKNVYRLLDSRPTKDELKDKLLKNVDSWFIANDKNYKRIIKKLKLPKNADVFEGVYSMVENADNIVFYKHITGFIEPDKDAVCVKKGKAFVWFNLETFEIII